LIIYQKEPQQKIYIVIFALFIYEFN